MSLLDEMNFARKIKEVKKQEFLLAQARYNLHLAEIEVQKHIANRKKLEELEKTNNG